MCAQGQRHRRQSLFRGRESSAVSKSSGGERGWIFSDSSKDRNMVLENVSASVIGGQVKGRGAILVLLADVTAISHERGKKKKLVVPMTISTTL
jgi:hypothetical protein